MGRDQGYIQDFNFGLTRCICLLSQTHIAQLDEFMVLMHYTIVHWLGGCTRVRVLRHDWAVDSPAALGRDFDVVIACDCIYYGGDGLPETMKVLAFVLFTYHKTRVRQYVFEIKSPSCINRCPTRNRTLYYLNIRPRFLQASYVSLIMVSAICHLQGS